VKLQRFVGNNTKSVLDEIRTTLGDEALIVSNTKVGSKTEIIAASEPKAGPESSQGDLQKTIEQRPESRPLEEDSSRIKFDKTGMDPWTHIKSINEEIRAIKSSLDQLPALSSEISNLQTQTLQSKEIFTKKSDDCKLLDTQTSRGCHVIWGNRGTGKTSVIKQLLRLRQPAHEVTSLIRLPHDHSSSDSHLADIASKNSVNLFNINNFESIEHTISLLGSDCLIFVEADLSTIPQIAARNDAGWLKTSVNYLIDEDEKQTELLTKLFSELNAETPITLNPEISEGTVYKMRDF